MLSRNLLLMTALGPMLAFAQGATDTLRTLHETQVLFAFGRWDIRAQDEYALQVAAQRWREAGPGALVRISAHTDAIGSENSNLRLSARRAQAVAAALQALGVDSQAIAQAYHGEATPVADNDTDEGRQRNRRAEIAIIAPVPPAPPAHSAPPVLMSSVSGRVTDPKSGRPVRASIYLTTNTWRDSLRTDENGHFSTQLPKDSVVRLEVFAPGYFFDAKTLRVGAQNPLLNFSLPPAVSGEKIALRNLLFYGNEAVLLPQSEGELPKVLRFMQLNPEVRIEIAGHINNPLKTPAQLDQWEWNLSVNRAKLVYDYLLKNGISPDRMRYKGYGNTEMIYPSPGATEEQQAQNRRVEIRVQ
ncbi:MAG: OmpA family protein [Saprospiraceae bacterium]|nr:OmpA family protein [Saprospiraceae bacterium]MDW8228396.1 OmpA family protein [Saprospiraceae bacterium]